jgi:hypothetical protein
MLLRINITVITSRTNGPTQQCTRPNGGRIKRGARQSRYDTRIGPRTGRGFQATVQYSPRESRIGLERRGGNDEGSRLKIRCTTGFAKFPVLPRSLSVFASEPPPETSATACSVRRDSMSSIGLIFVVMSPSRSTGPTALCNMPWFDRGCSASIPCLLSSKSRSS